MFRDQEEESAYRSDTRAFLEFCQDVHPGAPLSQRSLRLWSEHLEKGDFAPGERDRMRRSVETLFRHLGLLPEDHTV